ncbi:hypothetical protein [Duganella sp. P38]|uniref:hypothetical protein n=1 Tax=Duganella sp. P38 TaxID=3423949 RepID=UPI003D7B5BF8
MNGLRIALIGPLPLPAGSTANQTLQLAELLRGAGAKVELVQINAPCWLAWAAQVRGVRAALYLPPYLWQLWRAAGRAQLLHVMPGADWSWRLHVAPAIWIGRMRGKAVLLNYRDGGAAAFLGSSAASVRFTLRCAHAVIVPSAYLARMFEEYGVSTQIVPDVVNLDHFFLRFSVRAKPAF